MKLSFDRNAVELAIIARRAQLRHAQRRKELRDRQRKFWYWCKFIILEDA